MGEVIGLISTTFKKEFAEGISFALYFKKIKDFLQEHRIQT